MSNLQSIVMTNVKYYRSAANNLSQAKLAEMCELSTNYISEIENGRSTCSIKALEAIANALQIKPYQLLIDLDDDEIATKDDLLIKIEKELNKSMAESIKRIIDKYRD